MQHALEQRQLLTGGATNDDVRVARIALLEAQREKLARENAEAQGQLIPLDVLREKLSASFLICRQNLLQLPARIAPQLEGETRVMIKEKLRLEIYAALTAVAAIPEREPGAARCVRVKSNENDPTSEKRTKAKPILSSAAL
jgi:hypothetical protein